MRVEYAFLAQAADLSPQGTFSVLVGGLDTIELERVPGLLPSLSAMTQIVAEKEGELGEHRLGIQVLGPDKNEVNSFPEIPFQLLQSPEQPSSLAKFVCLAHMQGMRLASAGLYEIHLSVDGQVLKSIPLYIRITKKEEAT